ncbi:N-acetyllactosaminide beta-1,6-N-acetylglucosaminyl-transferase-like [Littorina saxatilis]|uniref:N-acetyllactosaminide beta-1,6-N-acetylglucosaminyl-transferase-like n=1 Tax=Littorina saxatilis TaxID=31220 RepID=UPI0038B627D0
MARCLDNVFVSSRSVKVRWGSFSVLEPELICMEDLLHHKGWKYFINLTGQEFPLKTNLEIVRILKAVKGANLVAGDRNSTWQQRRWRDKPPAPHNLTVVKGAVHVAVNRHFVDFAVNSPVARDLKEWCQDIVIPDEQFFPTLNHNPQLGIPGSYAGTSSFIKPNLVRYKNWDPSTCAGKRTRGICILSSGDLPLLGKRVELFANKFHAGYSSLAVECLAERLHNHTREETLGRRKVDVSFYESLPFLDNIVHGGSL